MWFVKEITNQKRLLLAASFVFVFSALVAQGGFNVHFYSNQASVSQCVHVIDSNQYISASSTLDTIGIDRIKMQLSKWDNDGNRIDEKTYGFQSSNILTREDTHTEVNNMFIQTSEFSAIHPVTGVYVQSCNLVWLNSNLDTLQTKILFSPYYQQEDDHPEMLANYAVLAKDSCVFITFSIFDPEMTGNDALIIKLSPTGEELWTYIYATEAESDVCFALLPQEGGGG